MARFGVESQAATRATYISKAAPHPRPTHDVHAAFQDKRPVAPREYSIPLAVPFPAVTFVRSACISLLQNARLFTTEVCEPFWKIRGSGFGDRE